MSKTEIVVSVCITSYNHAEFIAQCLDSILSQQTDFPFEILIGEDESSDGTREICQKYAAQFPERIKLFLRSREDVIYINDRPTGRYNFMETLKQATGKYIAICDGDDFWTDTAKLQKQVSFLEENKEYTLTHHAVFEQNDKTNARKEIRLKPDNDSTTELIKKNYIHTVSTLFRKESLVIPEWYLQVRQGDWPLWILLSMQGKIKYFEDLMACYRIHPKSNWSSSSVLANINMVQSAIEIMNRKLNYEFNEAFLYHKRSLYYYSLFNLARSGSVYLFFKHWIIAFYYVSKVDAYSFKDLFNHLKSFIRSNVRH